MKLYFVRHCVNGDILGTHECGAVPLRKANHIADEINTKEEKRAEREGKRVRFTAIVSEAQQGRLLS